MLGDLLVIQAGLYCLRLGLHAGHTSCAAALIGAGASLSRTCESSPVLHLAVCLGGQPGQIVKAEQIIKLLLKAGSDSDAK